MANGGATTPGLAQRLSDMQLHCAAVALHEPPVSAAQHSVLLTQLRTLAEFIDAARHDVATIGAEHVLDRDVSAATDELDAVVLHTAEATGLILDECERLDAAVANSPFQAAVTASTARIYEACSFQDITGQRVAKVVHTLQAIEAKVGEMLCLFGCAPSVAFVPPRPAALLNGPQHASDAMKQREVDALLASFE